MTDRNKKRIGLTAAISSVLVIVCGVLALTYFPGHEGAASEDKSSDDWVCPIDPDLTKEECDWVLLNDPGYLSEEDAKANFGVSEEEKGPGVLTENNCSWDSEKNIVNCEGDPYDNTFYIGKITDFIGRPWLGICLQGLAFWQFSPLVNYVNIQTGYGTDRIEVLDHSQLCIYNGLIQAMSPFQSSWSAYLVADGGHGADTIYGTQNADTIWGGPGYDDVDKIYGRAGNDYLYGVEGNDPIDCGTGSDHAYGGGGNDTFYCYEASGSAQDYLYGGNGYDIYYASSDGSRMNDLSHGSLDGNQFYGSSGIDYVYGDYGNDWVVTSGGNDVIYTYYGSDKIFSGCMESSCTVDDDTVYAGPDNDYIEGGNGSDNLNGEGGDDCIVGDNGINWLNGQEGSDTIDAGAGNDCVYCDDVIVDDYDTCQMVLYAPSGVPGDYAYGCINEAKCPNDCVTGSPAFCDNPG